MASPTIELSDIALIDLAYYLRYINRDQADIEAGQADQITQAINRVSREAERYCARPFLAASSITQPVDEYSASIVDYAPYDSIDDIPEDLKGASADIVRYYLFKADHYGLRSSTAGEKTKVFAPEKPVDAFDTLKAYKYWPPQQDEYLESLSSAGYFGFILE